MLLKAQWLLPAVVLSPWVEVGLCSYPKLL